MAWIDVNKQMPVLGRLVYVRGKYTPIGHGYPRAYLRDTFENGQILWCSTEWRGTCAISDWWDQ